MEFTTKNADKMRLVRCRQFTSPKSNKLLTFVAVADKNTYESIELMLSNDVDVKTLVPGQDYKVIVTTDGRYWTATLAEK